MQLAFGITLSTTNTTNTTATAAASHDLILYAVQSQVLGARLLPAELFALSVCESASQTKKFKVLLLLLLSMLS